MLPLRDDVWLGFPSTVKLTVPAPAPLLAVWIQESAGEAVQLHPLTLGVTLNVPFAPFPASVPLLVGSSVHRHGGPGSWATVNQTADHASPTRIVPLRDEVVLRFQSTV
jgi:hypothetical protein